MKFILARKVNMTQVFTEDGKVIPVTVLYAEPNKVTRLLTPEKDKYSAVQIGSGKKLKEFRTAKAGYEVGKEIRVTDFAAGELISLSGISRGRGFAGPMKRHGFHGAPASHGHDHPRAVGAIGQRFPQHVRPGLRMAGRMGGKTATVKNSMIVGIDAERNLIFVKGGVPGAPRSLIAVQTTGKVKEAPKIKEYGQKTAD